MSSTVKKISSVVQELAVVVPAADVESAAKKMFGRIAKTARVRGFRKGKVPYGVVTRMFGAQVYGEVTGDLTYKGFIDAVSEHGISPIGEPDFGQLEKPAAPGEDFSFTVKVEVAPVLDKLVTDGISLRKPKVVLDEAVIEKELERRRSALATNKPLDAPRPIAKGDVVTLEMRRFVEEENQFADQAMPPQEMVLVPEQSPDELISALPGKGVDDVVEIEVGPEDRRTRFQCKVTAHMERILPALDDDFARDAGDFDTLAQLREHIEESYRANEEKRIKERLKADLFEALREKNPMELPPTIVARQTEAFSNQYNQVLSQVGGGNGDEGQEMSEHAVSAAKEMVHSHFLVEEIARLNELKVDETDLDAYFEEMATNTGLPLARIKAEYGDQQMAAEINSRLMEDKVFDFVAAQVNIEEVASKTSAAKKATKKTATKKTATKKTATKKTATKKTATKKTATKKVAAKSDE